MVLLAQKEDFKTQVSARPLRTELKGWAGPGQANPVGWTASKPTSKVLGANL